MYNAKFKDNVVDQAAKAKRYMAKYSRYIYKAKEATIEALTGNDLQQVAVAGAESACGMDQRSPAELKLRSLFAFQWLACFLKEVESGKNGQVSSIMAGRLSFPKGRAAA